MSVLGWDFYGFIAAAAAAVCLYLGALWTRRQPVPRIRIPMDFTAYIVRRKDFSRLLLWASMALLLAAFVDWRIVASGPPEEGGSPLITPTQGIAIYLVLDRSGSMREMVGGETKIERLRKVTRDFVVHNPYNLLGVVAFARGAQILSPLTLDHKAVLNAVDNFDAIPDRQQDGTAIGYAIYKTANLIAATRHYAQELEKEGTPAYSIKNSVIVLVTDGVQDPNPADKENPIRMIDIPEAAAYAKEEGVRLYIINLEPRLGTDEFEANRHQMQRAAEDTGGAFFLASDTGALKQVYTTIDKLEKSQFPVQESLEPPSQKVRLYSYYRWFAGAALACLLVSILLQTTLKRVAP